MHIWQAIVEGLVQGLTEFLPVSSSAHLVFADHFLNLRLSDADTVFFDIMLHLGTLLAVLIYFYKDVWALLYGLGQVVIHPKRAWMENFYSRLAILLIIGTIPAAIAGKTLKLFFTTAFQNVPGTAAFLLVTAVMLFWISRRKAGERTIESLNWKDACVVGIMQAVAILPGISRSGATITGGLFQGLDRESAPRFSFLLSIPIILGGGLLELKDVAHTGTSLPLSVLLAGVLVAAISGYLAVMLLLDIVKRGKLEWFAYYCVIIGLAMLAYWTFLVPKIVVKPQVTPTAITQFDTFLLRTDGKIGPIELGQTIHIEVMVDAGMVPITTIEAVLPPAVSDTPFPVQRMLNFQRTGKGKYYISDEYKLYPLGKNYNINPAGEVRTLDLIVKNRYGMQSETKLDILVVPESLKNRTAKSAAGYF